MMPSIKNKLINLGLVFFGGLVALFLVEVTLRFIRPHNEYFSSIPIEKFERTNKFHQFFHIDSTYLYSVNEFGYRSPSLFSENRYGILTVGGSTTDCVGLSDNETWPWLLENKLNQSNLAQRFTVGNVGVPAFNSFHHVLQVKHLEPQFDNIKMVLLLVGINDYGRFLYFDKEELVPDEKELLHQTFVRHPRELNEKWFERSELWCYLRDFVNYIRRTNQIEHRSFDLLSAVKKYTSAIESDSLPNLEYGMDIMMDNIIKINNICTERGVKLVVITQPVLWHKNMTKEEVRISSYGKTLKDNKTFSDAAIARGMDIFNQRLLEVAHEHQINSIDLASQYPKNNTVFFDHCHYTKTGSSLFSDIVFDELKSILKDEQNLNY